MKFGNWLNSKLYPEWKFYYIDYDHLKAFLKDVVARKGDLEQYDEQTFVENLDKELKKVMDFKNLKSGEIERRVQYYEEILKTLNLESLEEKSVERIRRELEKITSELGHLGQFTRMNYTGFLKILKKHDKHTKFVLRPTYMVRLSIEPLEMKNQDELVLRLSKLYSELAHTDTPSGATLAQESAQVFVRKTAKYWVHADNVMDVKLAILKHLPVLVYSSRDGENADFSISSVYFDNDALELYTGRLDKTEGAPAIRIRWYGSKSPREVFVERKVHREDWTGEVSVKSRFLLKEKHVAAYLRGEYGADELIQKLRATKTEAEIEDLQQLANDIQKTISEKKLRPMLRTFYHRTAFQLPGDASVRISLDTELCMIREDGHVPSEDGWRRPDVLCEYPFSHLSATNNDIVRFPYAVLEVKLHTQEGTEPPQWISQLINGPMVESVPKFSKYVHGIAVLFEKNVSLFPFWLPQMNIDIRKPTTPLQKYSRAGENSVSDFGDTKEEEQPSLGDGVNRIANLLAKSPMLDSFSRNGEKAFASVQNTGYSSHIIDIGDRPDSPTANEPLLPQRPPQIELSSQPRLQIRRQPLWRKLKNLFKRPRNTRTPMLFTDSNNSKRIFVPVRVEPKVFFANERTFLSWLHFSIFLGGISSALLGLGPTPAKVSGYLFAAVSGLFAIYALGLYHWRAQKIRHKDPGPYDDLFGPSILAIVFIAAMAINIFYVIK